jgi:hypothetical protein
MKSICSVSPVYSKTNDLQHKTLCVDLTEGHSLSITSSVEWSVNTHTHSLGTTIRDNTDL